jgi:hypothetical protein
MGDAERLGRPAEVRVLDRVGHVPVVARFHPVLPGYRGDNLWKNVMRSLLPGPTARITIDMARACRLSRSQTVHTRTPYFSDCTCFSVSELDDSERWAW